MRPLPLGNFVLLALAALPMVRADVSVASIFTDHAVLQRGKPVPVWGGATPGEKVTVSYRDARVSTVADANGRWRIELPAQQPGQAAELIASGANRVVLEDVVVGEVWLASGQSNMAFTLERADNATAEIAAANFPQIRHFQTAFAPTDAPVGTVRGTWQVCSPATAGKFTAVGYFFARDLHQSLGVPIGIINSSVGGTPVEAWMPAEAFAAVRPSAEQDARDEANAPEKARARGKSLPGVLYNGMIAPLVPYGLRGFLWYQGEANGNARNPHLRDNYAENFRALITSWRQTFGQGDLPFCFVQLPNFKTPEPASGAWPLIRDAQSQALRLPATGMAVTIDVGNPNNIHPRNKQAVGHRLALIALREAYRQPVDATGPVLISQHVHGNHIRLDFDQKVRLKPESDASFEIIGRDGRSGSVRVSAEPNAVSIISDAISDPVLVRYAWSNSPTATLFNEAGLPAAPFQVRLSPGTKHP